MSFIKLRNIGSRKQPQGFTLLEVLTVMSVISILMALLTVGLQKVLGDSFSNEVSQLANTLVRARAYAMANNTYVFVGIQEVNAATSSAATQTTGFGRIGVTVVATNDGTRGYLASSIAANTTIPTTAGTQLVVVSPLVHLENLHMAYYLAGTQFPGSPNANGLIYYNLAQSTGLYKATAFTKFTWPVGSATPQYTFGGTNSTTNHTSVIQFDPQGEAQIVTGANTDAIYQWIEIDLQPTHGSTVPATSPNSAGIFINGPSGNVSIFRT